MDTLTKPYLLVVLLSFLVSCTNAKNRYSAAYRRHIDRRLRCGMMKNLLTDPQICRKTCEKTVKCFSINTYRYENGTEICELVKGTRNPYKKEGCFEWKTGWENQELEYTQTCPVDNKECNPKQYKKVLHNGWYQLGSTAFKLFPEHLTWHKAVSACREKGASIAKIKNEQENQFVTLLRDKRSPEKRLPLSLHPLAHWRLDNTDKNLRVFGKAGFEKDIDGATTVLHLPGTAISYAETPSYDIRGVSFTVSFWVNLERHGYVYSRWGSPYHFAIAVWNHAFAIHVFTDHNRRDIVMEIPPYYNRWTHYTAVWDRAKATGFLYLNGNKIYTKEYHETYTTLVPRSLSSAFDLGFKRDSNHAIEGSVSQLYLFNRTLTSKEVELVRDSFYMGNSAWIGINDIKTEGKYETDDSQVASYLNFSPGQKNHDIQDCVSVRFWDRGKMDFNHCNYTVLPYICMKHV